MSVSLWLHLIGAALLVGGGLVFGIVIIPMARTLPEAQRASFISKVARRFANVAWVALVLLLATGLTQLHMHGYPLIAVFRPLSIPGHFGQIFASKMLFFWILVALNVIEEIANPILRRRERTIESTAGNFRPGMLAKAHRTRMVFNALMGAVTLVLALAVLFYGVLIGELLH